MTVTFLGLNILHDTSAAIVVDGELVAAVEEERFNHKRHTTEFPTSAIEYCLKQAGVRPDDVRVGVTFDYHEFKHNTDPFEQHIVAHDDLRPDARERIAADNAATWRKAEHELRSNGFQHVRYLRHHLTHAACGYYLSGFDEAGILVIDGRGERESTTLWRAHGPGLDPLDSYGVAHSLGHLYTYVTSLCGLYSNIGNEGKTMGLAGYGTGQLTLEGVITYDAGRYRVDRAKMRELDVYQVPLGKPDATSRELAFAVQAKLEEVYHFLAARLVQLTGCRQLVLSGGVALNCNANGSLVRSPLVDRLFVPPAAGDAGTSIGAAFLQWVEHSGRSPLVPEDIVYLGPTFDQTSVEDAIRNSETGHAAQVADPAAFAAKAIAAGLIVGWCQGSMEFGPRALGNRSILADPRDPEMPNKINARVKYREPWRPFAPSVLEEESAAWFDPPIESPYMLLSFAVRQEKRSLVPAITHVDGTARIQSVAKNNNPLFYRVIDHFRQISGIPMVLNTSLNTRGAPMACTPADAVRCFGDSGLDVLVVGDHALWKDEVSLDAIDRQSPGRLI